MTGQSCSPFYNGTGDATEYQVVLPTKAASFTVLPVMGDAADFMYHRFGDAGVFRRKKLQRRVFAWNSDKTIAGISTFSVDKSAVTL